MWSKMAAIFSLLIPLALFAATREGQELIGTPAPAFNLDHWVNSSRLELSDLKAKCCWCAGGLILVSFARLRLLPYENCRTNMVQRVFRSLAFFIPNQRETGT